MDSQDAADPRPLSDVVARDHIARIDRTILALVAERLRLSGAGSRRLSDDSAARVLAAIAAEAGRDSDNADA